MNRFIRFGIVGTIGFLVDASILLLLVNIVGLEIYISRFFSFLIAVFVTWVINRNFTFEKRKKNERKKEYLYYLIIQSIGACINYFIFLILIMNFFILEKYLILPLAIASIIVMFFNYFTIKSVLYCK